jgi:hypothetical protein
MAGDNLRVGPLPPLTIVEWGKGRGSGRGTRGEIEGEAEKLL